jgi:hypothetical protein
MPSRTKPLGDREPSPTTVRLPSDLRRALVREAAINSRTLSAEIIERLALTLHGPEMTDQLLQKIEASKRAGVVVTDLQRVLLSLFDAMPPDKQLALLTVLRR